MLAQLNVNKTRTTDATLSTVLRGTEYITNKYGTDMRLAVGTDLRVGEVIAYRYEASDGGYYAMCSPAGSILKQETFDAKEYKGTCGGSFVVDGSCGSVVFGKTLSVRRDVVATVEEIITSVSSLAELYEALDAFNVNNEMLEDIVYMYLDAKASNEEGQQIAWDDILNAPSEFPPSGHSHTWDSIESKPYSFPPEEHTHGWWDINDTPDTFPPEEHTHGWWDIHDTPDTFPPEEHYHSWWDINDRPDTFEPSSHSHTWGEISDKPSTFAPSAHNHDDRYFTESEINSKLGGYLPLSGGTLTSTLAISGGADLQLRAASGNDAGDIVFQNSSGSEVARLWYSNNKLLHRRSSDNLATREVLHSGNFYDNIIKVKTWEKEITVPGTGAYTFEMGDVVTMSGYTFLGYTSQVGGYGDQWLISYCTYGSKVRAMVYSKYGASLTSKVSCSGIWVKNNYTG